MFEHIIGYLAIVLLAAVLALIFWMKIRWDQKQFERYLRYELDQARQYCDKVNYNIDAFFKQEKEKTP